MWRRLLFMLPIILSASSIRVPVDPVSDENTATEVVTVVQDEKRNRPIYYLSDEANGDSYLIPPDHKPKESLPDVVGGPLTYLVPPSKEQTDFYVPQEPSAQSDWLPILQAQTQNKRNIQYQRLPLESIPIFFNRNQPQASQISHPIPTPSTHLEPPSVDAVNEYFVEVPEETEVHVDENNEPINPQNYNIPIQNDNTNAPPVNQRLKPAEPTLTLQLTPPKLQSPYAPTKLYPKKYAGGFKPVPIPLAQFSEESAPEVPKAKPAKYFKPPAISEVEPFKPSDEKKLYHYQKAEHQRKLKGEDLVKQHQLADGAAEETYGGPTSAEQETSETNLRYPGRNVYPAALRQAPPPVPPKDVSPAAPAPDGRTEFRMHGMKGPHSYQFGYDTGKGKNRQFRYEERDNDGLVKGHYGYVDRSGKLRVVNYSAHPEYGFRAEEPVEKQS